jgi:pimeloyl-ACP methyl ester carboxylesterase
MTRSPAGLAAASQMWGSFNLPSHDLRGDAKQISAPTLVVWGRQDPVLPVSAAQTVHNLIKGSTLLWVDSGHIPHTTEPATVAAGLLPLLDVSVATSAPTGLTESASLDQKDGQR